MFFKIDVLKIFRNFHRKTSVLEWCCLLMITETEENVQEKSIQRIQDRVRVLEIV